MRLQTFLALGLLACACGGPSSPPAPSTASPPAPNPAASGWSPPVLALDGVFGFDAAVDGGGNILLVWLEGLGSERFFSGQRIWAKRFVPATGWGPPETVYERGESGRGPGPPRVAILPSGGAIVTWVVSEDKYEVWVDAFDPATGWSTPLRLAETDGAPMVATDGADGGFVVFTRDDVPNCWPTSSCSLTYASRWSLKRGFSSPELVLQGRLQTTDPALVAADGAGNAFVARSVLPYPQPEGIAVARFELDRDWLAPVFFPAPREVTVFLEALATDPTGNTLALWDFITPTASNLWGASFRPSSGWGSPQRIDSSTSNVHRNAVAAWNQNGGALAVWPDASPSGLWSNRMDSTGAWGTPQSLRAEAGATCPTITSDLVGGFVAAWEQFPADKFATNGYSIWADRFRLGHGWEKPALVVASANSINCPSLVAAPDGHPLLFWSQSSEPASPTAGSKGFQVYMSRLENQ